MKQQTSVQVGHNRTLTRLFWVAMAAQAILAIFVMKPWLTGDSRFYLGLAQSIENGFYGWVQGGQQQADALRPPGYPLVLWLLLHRLHLALPSVIVLQMALYIASIWLMVRRLDQEGISSSTFRLLALIYPFGALYCAFVMAEAWATLALTGIAVLVSSRQLTVARLLISGAIAGLITLFRSDMLLLPLVIAFVAIARDWRSKRVPAILGRAVVPVLAAAAMLAPYAAWNSSNFNRFSPIPVASAVGNSLYLASWQGKLPLADLNALYEGVVTKQAAESGLVGEMRQLNSSFGAPPLTAPFNPAAYATAQLQEQSSEVYLQAAERRIAADPVHYATHVLTNVWALWNSSIYPPAIPAIGQWAMKLVSGLVWLAGGAGLLLALFSRRPIGAAALVTLYPMVVHLPLHTEARYTAAARPLLLMFASIAVLWLVRCYREGRLQLSGEKSVRI